MIGKKYFRYYLLIEPTNSWYSVQEVEGERTMRTFQTDLELAEVSEAIAFELLCQTRGLFKSLRPTPIQYWYKEHDTKVINEMPYEFDFLCNEHRDDEFGIEIKSLAGHPRTFCIERWKDDNKRYEPSWIKATRAGKLKIVMIHRRDTDEFYLYEAKQLLAHIEAQNYLVRASVGVGGGWLGLGSWTAPETGFRGCIGSDKVKAVRNLFAKKV